MSNYPFYNYIQEDKSRYTKARDAGYIDDADLFLIGDSGGFLLNINPNHKFVNTELFTEVADFHIKNKVYSNYRVDSIPHRQFRRREEHRRKVGFTAKCLQLENGDIVDVRITGSHYNFLNYTKMEQLDESKIKRSVVNTSSKKYSFPKFIDAQFWTFHVMEFCENNGLHLIVDKTRRGGFSYIMAADSSNDVNVSHHTVVVHVAADKKYLVMTGGLSDFSTTSLRFYEQSTPFVRGVVSPSKEDFKLGFKLPNGLESDQSWKSSLISVSANNNPDCALGKDAKKVKVEEISTMSNFDAFMNVTEPSMRTGAYTTGSLYAWGTSSAGNMQVFEQNFYNPRAYNFMAFENVWDVDSRSEICGYFKPYAWGLQGELNGEFALDRYGNSDILLGLKIAANERLNKKNNSKTYSEYIIYLGQYANMPSESFSNTSENIFSSEELTAWELKLKSDSDLHFYVDGMIEELDNKKLVFKSNAKLLSENKKVYDYITGVPRRGSEHPMGCIRRWFPPEYEERYSERGGLIKEIPVGLYSISYDPVGINKENKLITNKHSHNSISVWMNPHALNGFKQKLVASYYGRPEKLETADKICYDLARMYNCVGEVHVEVNRGETVSNFRKWSALKYLAYEPIFVWDTSIKETYSSTYGYVMGDTSRKLEAIRYLREMLYEVVGVDEHGNNIYTFNRIFDYQTILELKKFNSEGNFDRVSQLLIRAIDYKAKVLKSTYDSKAKLTAENIDNHDILNRPWF